MMVASNFQERAHAPGAAGTLKSWTMVVLTLAFVLLYWADLTSWLKPLTDEKMVLRLEPIIFVIIGYYIGPPAGPAKREDSQGRDRPANTKSRRRQNAKEQALQTREGVEEKLKNVSAALTSAAPSRSATAFAEDISKSGGPIKEEGLRYSIGAALKILNS